MDELSPRERILYEATSLFGRKGFAATSVREVVQAAGISKPTLYYYFDNKESLYRECVKAQFDGMVELIDHTLTRDGTVRERLQWFLEQYVRGGIDNPDCVRLLMLATAPIIGPQPETDVLASFRAEVHRLVPLIEQEVQEGKFRGGFEPSMVIRMLCGSADTFLIAGLCGDPVPDDFAAQLLELLYRGIHV